MKEHKKLTYILFLIAFCVWFYFLYSTSMLIIKNILTKKMQKDYTSEKIEFNLKLIKDILNSNYQLSNKYIKMSKIKNNPFKSIYIIDKKEIEKSEEKQIIFRRAGIITGSGGKPLVILENILTGKTHHLNEGDSIDSYTIKKILKNKVIIKYKNTEYEL